MLAVFAVTNLFDAGAGSLRQAVIDANNLPGADTVAFDAALSGDTITLGGAELEITEAVTIDATSLDENVTIDASNDSRIFNITATSGDFTLAGLTLTGGRTIGDNVFPATTFSGGAVRSLTSGNLTIDQSTVSGNSTTGSGSQGGGVFSLGTVSLTSSTVSGNSTTGNSALGGGISAKGSVWLSGSMVNGNSTTGSGSEGGGIRASSPYSFHTVTLFDSTVSGNSTAGSFAEGGGISTVTSSVRLYSSTVSGNGTTGTSTVASGSYGGGIRTFSGNVTLTNSTLSGNSTTGDSANGGGIFTTSGDVTLTGSTLSGNNTAGDDAEGGGISTGGNVTLTDSTVSGNSTTGALADGGGIYSIGDVMLTDSTVSGNSTVGFDSAGGGIFSRNSVMLTRSTVSGNSTAGSEYAGGGGIYSVGSVTLTHSTVSGNSTAGNYAVGGGILSYGPVTLTHSTVTANHTDHAAASGGGIWNFNDPIVITNSIVAGNTATGGMNDIDPGTGSLNIDFSLIEQTGLMITGSGNVTGLSPNLGPLTGNGGPTKTHALLPGSPAIDAGDPSIVPNAAEFDQRGAPFVRVYDDPMAAGTGIDMGAYERQTVAGLNLVVDTPADESDGNYTAGDLSLREAIGLASGSVGVDTITFDAVVFAEPQTITLGLGEIGIGEAVTIDGPGEQFLTINAQQQSRIFNITATTGDFTLAGLSLTGGRTTDSSVSGRGGAIHSSTFGSLTIDQSKISGNSTTGLNADGGGIYSRGLVTLTDSKVIANHTEGNYAGGGGIYTVGGASLSRSTISGNQTDGLIGAGGGIFSLSIVPVTLTLSTVSGNSTAGGEYSDGGGIYAVGAVTLTDSTVSGNSTAADDAVGGGIRAIGNVMLTRSTVSGNSTAGFGAYGGGIYSKGDVMLIGSTVSGNSTAATFARGGGIYAQGAVTLTDSTISGNSTGGVGADGGGISSQGTVTLTSSTVSGNFTTADSADGGGVFSLSGAVALTHSTVSGNSTVGNSADGGGIYSKGAVTLTHSTITDNHANHANAFGGGIWNDNDSIVIDHSIVAGNTDGGGLDDIRPGTGSFNVNFSLIEQTGLTIAGGDNIIGISADLGPLASNGGLTQTHALLSTSPAIDAGDPSIVFNPAEFDQRSSPFVRVFDGDAIGGARIDMGAYERQTVAGLNLVVDTPDDENDGDYTAGDLSLREAVGLANGSVGADTITFDAVVFATPQSMSLGLGELDISEAVTIDGPGQHLLTIDASASDATPFVADGMGSRIFEINDGNDGNLIDVTISGLTLSGGDVSDEGGAIRSRENLSVISSTLTGNSVVSGNAEGGGIYQTLGDLHIEGSTISANTIDGGGSEGGGIFAVNGNVTIVDSTISDNSATGNSTDGGGIIFVFGDLTIENSTISGNSADDEGGGIFGLLGNVTINNSTISGNSAGGSGGGIALSDFFGPVTATIAHSTITDNSADALATGTHPGGGIYIDGATVSLALDHTIVGGNSDSASGAPDISGTVNADYSLIEDGTGVTIIGVANLTGLDPLLGPLASNGGPTRTHALLSTSPAIDAGDPSIVFNPAEFDQRSSPFVRVFDGDAIGGARIDMGAYERQAVDGLYFIVNTLVDENDGDHSPGDLSLREALDIANGSTGADTITFDAVLTGGTIFLTLGHLAIISDVTIAGLGADALTIDAQGMSSVIRVFDSATVDISGLTLTGGRDHRGGAIRNSDGGTVNVINSTLSGNSATSGGGAIYNRDGIATVTNSTISGNFAVDSSGGAIGNGGGGTVTVTSSTISGNTAERGGGILNTGTVTVASSTISGNWATIGDGGGISNSGYGGSGVVNIASSTISGNWATNGNGGGVFNTATATITSSTISRNTAAYDGGGIYDSGTAHVTMSIVAGNMAGVDADVFGPLDTDSFNLIGGDPMLGPLTDNGGPTETHALLPGSPAIDAGDPSFIAPPDYDQRGAAYERVHGAGIDIGAYELLLADGNFDGQVNGLDYLLWAGNFGDNPVDDPPGSPANGDYNNDGVVNGLDYLVWASQFGEGAAVVAAVPVAETFGSAASTASKQELAAIDLALEDDYDTGAKVADDLAGQSWRTSSAFDSALDKLSSRRRDHKRVRAAI